MAWWIDLTIDTGLASHPAELCLAIQDELPDDLEPAVGNTPRGELAVGVRREDATLLEAVACRPRC